LNRLFSALACALLIIIGLCVRHYSFWGDFTWACFIFCFVRLTFHRLASAFVLSISLLFCYAIEISQIFHPKWLVTLREDRYAQLVLGHGTFSWQDILAYSAALLLCAFLTKTKLK
jgi:hypothetical protein